MGLYEPDENRHWHVGWEWHAGMWYVDPPLDCESLTSEQWETKWFHDRDKAFAEVERQQMSIPVESSPLDNVTVMETQVTQKTFVPEYAGIRQFETSVVDQAPIDHTPPQYIVSGVSNPTGAQVNSSDSLADYQARVGLQR